MNEETNIDLYPEPAEERDNCRRTNERGTAPEPPIKALPQTADNVAAPDAFFGAPVSDPASCKSDYQRAGSETGAPLLPPAAALDAPERNAGGSPTVAALDGESTPSADTASQFPAAASPAVADYFDLDPISPISPILPMGPIAFDESETGNLGCDPIGSAAEIEPEANSGYGASALRVAAAPIIEHQPPSACPVARTTRLRDHGTTDTDLREAQARANLCQRFEQLTASGLSLTQAARALGKSPSWFSGYESMYERWLRDGLAGLSPRSGGLASAAISDLTREIEALPWFIPAAQFFYLLSNRTRITGSVPEAILRVISLPHLPPGWTHALRDRFLKAVKVQALACAPGEQAKACTPALPIFPAVLREQILARQAAGQSLVPDRIARQIRVNPSVVQHFRSPREWSLQFQTAPGSQRRYFNAQNGQRQIMDAGDWFGGDDATPGIALCIPCKEVRTPCSLKFGVLLGRFQWLAYHDASADKILAWDYVVRPRGSYRAEDILNGMGAVTRTHGIPRHGWQFEGGSWNSKLVRQAIKLLGCEHWRTYSPHQKAIESVFNRVWTRLAVQFPHADMGRFRNENAANCLLYEACKAGHKDPRRYFPTLEIVVQVFTEEVAAHNARKIFSDQYGQWIPDALFAASIAERPLRECDRTMDWIFAPFAAERKVRGMLVRCRVPMFENFSVPFEFGADWLPHYDGHQVRIHFNPREPKCVAKVVLLDNAVSPRGQAQAAGAILGDAKLIGETASHIRYIMEWGDDNQRAGYLERQRVANFVRRETRGVGIGGRVEYSKSEERNGLDTVTTVVKTPGEDGSPSRAGTCPSSTINHPSSSRASDYAARKAARAAELEVLRSNAAPVFE